MPERLPALIFDFGNVFSLFDYAIACEKLGRPIGLSGQEFLRLARERGLTPLVHSYERGDLASREFASSVCEIMNISLDYDEFALAWADIFRLNLPVARLVRHLKRSGYTLVLGSNSNEIHASHFREQFRVPLRCFEKLIFSYEIRHIKPSREFYLACAKACRARPEDCVFIDDLLENVEGARGSGMKAIQFMDAPGLIADLSKLGVEVGGLEG